MSFIDSIADAAARLHALVEGGDSAWTAVCGLESTVRRLPADKAASSLHAVMTLAVLIKGKDDDTQARMIVGCEAIIQGLCPKQAWADWSRLHGG
jgi:hypothetical protein